MELALGVSGGRVSNTWAICLTDWDNAWKRVLIPDRSLGLHGSRGKGAIASLSEEPAAH